jgi:hypothetical protein
MRFACETSRNEHMHPRKLKCKNWYIVLNLRWFALPYSRLYSGKLMYSQNYPGHLARHSILDTTSTTDQRHDIYLVDK